MLSNYTATTRISHAEALRTKSIKRGLIKCRLIHMKHRSFVFPDLLFSTKLKGEFYAPKFFTPNRIAFFGEGGANDFCRLTLELTNGTDVEVAFFQRDLQKACRDGSYIYKCAFYTKDAAPMPVPCGKWRKHKEVFELLLYHHTNKIGRKGIEESLSLIHI